MPLLSTKSSVTCPSVEKEKSNPDLASINNGVHSNEPIPSVLSSHAVINSTANRPLVKMGDTTLPDMSNYPPYHSQQPKSTDAMAHIRSSTQRQILNDPQSMRRPSNETHNLSQNPVSTVTMPSFGSLTNVSQCQQQTIQTSDERGDKQKFQKYESAIKPMPTIEIPPSSYVSSEGNGSAPAFPSVAAKCGHAGKSKKSSPLSKKRKDPGTHMKTSSVPSANLSVNVATSMNVNDMKSKHPLPLTEKKLRRLERNRLSARECRRRKREAAESMLHEINLLEAENVQLRLQLQIGYEAECSVNDEQQKLTLEIDTLLKSGEASEADIQNTLEEFKEKYADYGQSRRSSIEFHLRNIARLLMPTQTTSVVMHAFNNSSTAAASVFSAMMTPKKDEPTDCVSAPRSMESINILRSTSESFQSTATNETSCKTTNPEETTTNHDTTEKSFVASAESISQTESSYREQLAQALQEPAFDPKKLFSFLVQYLQVTPSQAVALKDSRFVAQEMDSCLEEALKVLSQLRERLTKTGDDLEKEFNNVRSILTPTQAAKFLVWVANNAACMHMLNELWDRVYPSSG